MYGILALLDRARSSRRSPPCCARDGTGAVVAVEGPGGIGKTAPARRARPAPASAGCAGCTRAAPSSSATSVRRRTPALRAGCSTGGRPASARGPGRRAVALALRARAARGGRRASVARLHGLYWLCATLAADGAALVRRRRAPGRCAVAALPRLPRAPLEDLPVALVLGSRPRSERTSDCSRRCSRPAHAAPASAPADRRRGRPAALRGRSSRAEPGSCAPAAPTTAATRSSCASSCSRCRDEQRRTRRRGGRDGGASSAAWRHRVLRRLLRLPAGRPRWRGRSPSWARARTLGARRRLAGLRRAAPARWRRRPEATADVLTRDSDRARLRASARPRRDLRGLPGRASATATCRAARLLTRRGGAPNRLASRARRPARDAWAIATLAPPRAARSARGDPARAAAYLRRALAEPPAARTRPAAASSARPRRCAARPAPRSPTWRGARRRRPTRPPRGPRRACARPPPASPARRRAAIVVLKSALDRTGGRGRRPRRRAARSRSSPSAYISLVARPARRR